MDLIQKFIEKTKNQFQHNALKNIFDQTLSLSFTNEIKELISKSKDDIRVIDENSKEYVISYCVSHFIKTFYEYYPYLHFKNNDYLEIRTIYLTLFEDIINIKNIDDVEKTHYHRIRNFIKKNNPYYYLNNKKIEPRKIIYTEYSAKTQIDILKIKIDSLHEPVLDIGCGKSFNLVKYLRSLKVNAYGIDRMIEENEYIFNCDFLSYDYGSDKWGTIISNLAFSSHFINHYFIGDNQDIEYAKTYMKILQSLQKKGSFIYAPSLPFIEDLLPSNQYLIDRMRIDNGFFGTKVTKI